MKRLLLVVSLALALPASALAWEGSYATGDAYGTSVRIEVSDAYPVDQALPQGWATFLGTLVHGPELATLTLRLLSADELSDICGPAALACYDTAAQAILATPESSLDEPSAQEVVMHEYGHHVANNRSNAPFDTGEYGTKRWASYENICARTASGELSPGDEGVEYAENPGEAFAESYRVLNLMRAGQTSIAWDLVDRSFYPDATALQLLTEDVLDPWTKNTASQLRGTFGAGVVRTFSVSTPLDGTFTARLRSPARSRLRLLVSTGNTPLARGTSVRVQICGERRLTVKVQRLTGRGPFTLDVSKP